MKKQAGEEMALKLNLSGGLSTSMPIEHKKVVMIIRYFGEPNDPKQTTNHSDSH